MSADYGPALWSKGTLAQRFWSNVTPSHEPDCWLWQGVHDRRGYGRVHVLGRQHGAHRIAWRLTCGPIPQGLGVLHKCDVPACCNPAHLFLGTQRDNMQDAAAKGRIRGGWPVGHPAYCRKIGDDNPSRKHPERLARGDRNGSRLHPERLRRGEGVGTAKLTADQVSTIRERYAAGGVTQRQLAREFGVSQGAIFFVLSGRNWRQENV